MEPETALERAREVAGAADLRAEWIATARLDLLAFHRGLDRPPERVRVYLAGDGRGWPRGRPPADPTPADPLALRLAARDPAPAVLHLSRPCQYALGGPHARGCAPRHWTSDRFSAEVVAATGEALDRLLARAGGRPRLTLVGYSGGGVIAALLAAGRPDVERLVTVAAPLHLGRWTALHRASPLAGSLDPVAHAAALARVPQRHLAGGRDRIVPPEVVRAYLEALPRPASARLEVREDFDHRCCWVRDWPALLAHGGG